MKKFLISSFAILTTFVFINCSGGSDDDDSGDANRNCITCELMALDTDIIIINEFCDNEDGTFDLTVTTQGQTATDTFPFAGDQTIEDLAALDISRGAVCDN